MAHLMKGQELRAGLTKLDIYYLEAPGTWWGSFKERPRDPLKEFGVSVGCCNMMRQVCRDF